MDIPKYKELPSGTKYPVVGLGTYNRMGPPGSMFEAVKYAIDIGYRSVDCAYVYDNEKAIGDAIKAKVDDGTIKNKREIFITTKLWCTHHNPKDIKENCQKSLERLQVDCIQLFIMHWPISMKDGDNLFPQDANGTMLFSEHDITDTWKGMEELVACGMVENIGLSNFNKSQIERILKIAKIKPCNNQIEVHPYLSNRKLIDFCYSNSLTVTAYSPLVHPNDPKVDTNSADIFKESILIEMSKKKEKTIPQIVLRFLLQRNIIVIPKSITPSRIKENLNVFDFCLSDVEMQQIWSLDRKNRIIDGDFLPKGWCDDREYPFNDEY